jgi:hypothetical protein
VTLSPPSVPTAIAKSRPAPLLTAPAALGSAGSTAASQTDLPVAAAFRTPAASINATATGSLTETEVQAVLQSMYQVTGTMNSMMLVCGPELKRAFTGFTRFAGGTDNKAGLSVRTFTQSAESKKIVASIDSFHGDFGVLDIVPSLFLAKDQVEASQLRRGYVLSSEMLELRYGRRPRFQELEDAGGGKRALVDAIAALVCHEPQRIGQVRRDLLVVNLEKYNSHENIRTPHRDQSRHRLHPQVRCHTHGPHRVRPLTPTRPSRS